MSEYQYLKVEKTEGAARITLDRPKHNVLDIDMMNELIAELGGLAADDELKCLVINGAGASFCAGVEVAVGHEAGPARHRDLPRRPDRRGGRARGRVPASPL